MYLEVKLRLVPIINSIGNTKLEVSNNSQKIYGLPQCIQELSEKDCNHCWVSAFGYMPWCCYGKAGGRVSVRSVGFEDEIFIRWEIIMPVPKRTCLLII
ncbi:putative Gnk2-like domain-containing protein [Rosa chinensis]|uniref:Putative Gnk2-like domain-containing protein n=1 Tax=Rosa chinensis TaxID=74649 RepID=A0A2P6S6R9_ROSCH|nr:putative Gnk2-like domain-containing protein [Rosa chinensis]